MWTLESTDSGADRLDRSRVHVFLLLILRLTGKRQVGQLAPFDLVLLLKAVQRGPEFDERRRQFPLSAGSFRRRR